MKRFLLALVLLVLIILGVLFFLSSCNNSNDPYGESEGFMSGSLNAKTHIIEEKYQVVVIEDCEYIIYTSYSGYSGFGYMAHKGNCNNPIHVYNKK